MSEPSKGRLRVYLGFAAGVGKTFRMLEDAQSMGGQGVDVVVGYFEPHDRPETIARTKGLEFVPRRTITYKGLDFEEMDTAAVLRRKPRIVLVDELAHTNVPGCERPKRWQDVLVLLDSGIDVWTTVNIQHLESLNDKVAGITGVRVRETLPDWVLAEAAEVVMVDLTPQALLNRLRRGVVYPPEQARKAIENFFKEGSLAALRELAIRQTAHEVDARQQPSSVVRPVATAERILIEIRSDPATAALIRRARRVADYLKAQCFAVCIQPSGRLEGLAREKREAIERHIGFARSLHIDVRLIPGDDPAMALVDFARLHRVNQIFLARPPTATRFPWRSRNAVIRDILRIAGEIRVVVIAERSSRRGP